MIRKLLCSYFVISSLAMAAKPKLVVVISVDQFAYEYLVRFEDHFGPNGFRYLLENGANFSAATYKHAKNTTGPGHATILSGSYAEQNGIIANTWYDITAKQDVGCVRDKSTTLVGAEGVGSSPINFIGSTVGDELRISSNFQSKVISVSLKDRSAILLGGKLANGAYWMVDSSFVTSTYYTNPLPVWVSAFNTTGIINSYFGKKWERILPDEAYSGLDNDDAPYEDGGDGLGRTFPHTINGDNPSKITRSYYYALHRSPFGDEILSSFAKEAVKNERLGKDDHTDLLCIGLSATDEVGHAFGPHSQEILDMCVHTDQLLADLFGFLEIEVGLHNCTIVLTADHGITPIPEYILAHVPKTDAGRVKHTKVIDFCNAALTKTYGRLKNGSWIKRSINGNIYFDRDALFEKKLSVDAAAQVLADSLATMKEIAAAVAGIDLVNRPLSLPIEQKMRRSFYALRSGDVIHALKPFYIEDDGTVGTDHGEPYDCDAHVPLIIIGDGVRSGTYATDASPADIAPTLAIVLGVEFPAGCEGRVLTEALKLP